MAKSNNKICPARNGDHPSRSSSAAPHNAGLGSMIVQSDIERLGIEAYLRQSNLAACSLSAAILLTSPHMKGAN